MNREEYDALELVNLHVIAELLFDIKDLLVQIKNEVMISQG
jgi:hypothetical protein